MTHSVVVEFSPLDSERFSIRVARAAHITGSNLSEILDFCASTSIDLLIARCETDDIGVAQRIEKHGFLIMDTLVYSKFDLIKDKIPDEPLNAEIRTYRSEDRPWVRQIAAGAFKGYRGHYHADPKLDSGKCDEAYVSWAERSCDSKSVADEVLIAEYANRPAAFATMRLNSPQEAEGVLFAVAPDVQGRGIFRSLLIGAMRWCKEKKVDRMLYSTQLTNIAAEKVLCRVGFQASHSLYTFHKWFTGAET